MMMSGKSFGRHLTKKFVTADFDDAALQFDTDGFTLDADRNGGAHLLVGGNFTQINVDEMVRPRVALDFLLEGKRWSCRCCRKSRRGRRYRRRRA